jgi:hypothetical protein
VVVDPARRLAEEEAAVSAGRARADPAPLDERDAVAALGEEPRDREARDSPADDDRVPGQLAVDDSASSDFLRQKRSAPATALTPATIATVFGRNREPERLAGTAAFAFRFTARLAIGLAAV